MCLAYHNEVKIAFYLSDEEKVLHFSGFDPKLLLDHKVSNEDRKNTIFNVHLRELPTLLFYQFEP